MRAPYIVIGASILAGLLSSAEAAKAPKRYRPPHTEFGHPDFQGVWNFNSDVPLERPAQFADREFMTREELQKLVSARTKQFESFTKIGVGLHDVLYFEMGAHVENLHTSLIRYPANGRLPKLRPGVIRIGGTDAAFMDIKGTTPVRFAVGGIGKDGPEQRGVFERCISGNSIPYFSATDNNNVRIVQNRNYVILTSEHIHDARIVPLDGRPFSDDRLRSWIGESRGHFEGDTLVVVTKNFNGLSPSLGGAGNNYDKVVTERFTRTGEKVLEYSATVEDPSTFEDKIELSYPMGKIEGEIYEFACHEGNYSMAGILAGARKAELEYTEKN